jgi:hypothetical protein
LDVGCWTLEVGSLGYNMKPPTSNLKPQTSNFQPPTSNFQHPTSNVELYLPVFPVISNNPRYHFVITKYPLRLFVSL